MKKIRRRREGMTLVELIVSLAAFEYPDGDGCGSCQSGG